MAKHKTVEVTHPKTGEKSQIKIPADHDGSRVKVEFPDGVTAWIEGWDPAERAASGERPQVPCGKCGATQTLVAESFVCSACGAHNTIALKISADDASADERVAD